MQSLRVRGHQSGGAGVVVVMDEHMAQDPQWNSPGSDAAKYSENLNAYVVNSLLAGCAPVVQ